MENLLKRVYSHDNFKEIGYELIDILSEYLSDSQRGKLKVSNWIEPNDQLKFWDNYKIDSPSVFFEDVLKNSINVHNPKYIGHQISPTAPISALSGLLSSILNNGMGTYEMGAAATAIEKVVIQEIVKKIGFDEHGDGFITSGGTLANLTALLSARKAMAESDIWEDGMNDKLAVIVSSEAHYCVDRALRIMGFGAKGIIKIPVGEKFNMQTNLLNEYYNEALAQGLKVIAVVGSAPSTSTGMYDDLEAIATFCKKNKLWFHVDGAHGGAAIFSKKYKYLLNGIEYADSVVIDGHKMLMTPSIMTFLLFKNKQHSYETFSQKAEYLWSESEEQEWYNLAQRTFECTKHMMSIQFFSILRYFGEEVFDEFVTHLYDLAQVFAKKVKEKNNFELALSPHSNIVCFRYTGNEKSKSILNELNNQIRQAILVDGEFYIVKTILNDTVYLRTTFMNPRTDENIMNSLLEKIEQLAEKKTFYNKV